MLKDAIKSRAGAVAALTALIGTRFYNVQGPQDGAIPYCTFQIVSSERVHVMGRDTLGRARVQVDSWGATYESVENVNTEVVNAFNRWSGTVSSVVVKDTIILSGGVDIQADEDTRRARLTSEMEVVFEL